MEAGGTAVKRFLPRALSQGCADGAVRDARLCPGMGGNDGRRKAARVPHGRRLLTE